MPATTARISTPSLLRTLWSLPNTLLGLAFAAASATWPTAARGVLIATSSRGLAQRFLVRRGFYAITFGRVVISTGPMTEELLEHEIEHVRQYERWGPFFIPLYLWQQLTRGYYQNCFEIQAVAAAHHFAQQAGEAAQRVITVPARAKR